VQERLLARHRDFHVGLGVGDEVAGEVDRHAFERAGEGEVILVSSGATRLPPS
jgi:hypothetical protein